ncbi:hypothetical protein PPHE_b0428 [Pseudoalteromonas phenolica O-BC30]|nr:hypothetical protein [Pseudoalteromonas phenolica O-BC30]
MPIYLDDFVNRQQYNVTLNICNKTLNRAELIFYIEEALL